MTAVRLTVHDDPAAFLAAAGRFLRAAEAENSIITTPVARMVAAPHSDDAGAYLATADDGAGVVAAAFKAGPGEALVTAGPDAALAVIAGDMAARGIELRGIVGPLASCEAFARRWRERTGRGHRLRFHLRHFALTVMPALPPVSGRMREPDPGERSALADWAAAFVAELDMPDSQQRARASFSRRFHGGRIVVWDDRGTVAMAGYGDGEDTARIAPVYTPPPLRRRGYASALVAALSRELLGRGKRALFLTTDVANPTSNSIYQKIGYRAAADHFHFEFVPLAP